MPQGFLRRTAALCLLFLLSGLATAAGQAGRISGQVTDLAGAPIEAARLLVVGTSLIETTNRDGRYTFRSINPGRYQVRVFAIGYQSKTDTVSVGPDETAALDFKMVSAPVTLDEIVVTTTAGRELPGLIRPQLLSPERTLHRVDDLGPVRRPGHPARA